MMPHDAPSEARGFPDDGDVVADPPTLSGPRPHPAGGSEGGWLWLVAVLLALGALLLG